MTKIKAPASPTAPLARLCWKQSPNMVRCDRKQGHKGDHSWGHVGYRSSAFRSLAKTRRDVA